MRMHIVSQYSHPNRPPIKRLDCRHPRHRHPADEQATFRCPYKNRFDQCTARFGCRNQRKPQKPDGLFQCGGDDQLDYRSAWESAQRPSTPGRGQIRCDNTSSRSQAARKPLAHRRQPRTSSVASSGSPAKPKSKTLMSISSSHRFFARPGY